MNLNELSERCAEDNARYRRDNSAQVEHCFELMKLALQEDNGMAFTHLYRAYATYVHRWVQNHPGFRVTGESEDYFVSVAFSNFYFAGRGTKFEKFDNLAAALAYLKVCVHSAVLQYIRKQRVAQVPLEEVKPPSRTPDFDRVLHQQTIWEHINQLLQSDADRGLAHLSWVQELKPSEISNAYSTQYPTARHVSVALQRLRRTLRKDTKLRNLLGLNLTSTSEDGA